MKPVIFLVLVAALSFSAVPAHAQASVDAQIEQIMSGLGQDPTHEELQILLEQLSALTYSVKKPATLERIVAAFTDISASAAAIGDREVQIAAAKNAADTASRAGNTAFGEAPTAPDDGSGT